MLFKIQLLLLLSISLLLFLPVSGVREWQRLAEEGRTHSVMSGWDGLTWFTWLAAAPLILWLIRRYPLEPGRMGESVGRVLLGSVTLYLVVVHMRYFLHTLIDQVRTPPLPHASFYRDNYAFNFLGMLPLDCLIFGGFFAVSLSIDYFFKFRLVAEETRQLQLRAAQLQSELTRAELTALRSQLHPHFLFNSFNALATLVRQQKNDAAVEIIAQLSALLRMAIDRTGWQEIPLEQELDFIARYLAIEQVRFGDKLLVEYAVEPAAQDALVPNIVLQPLVENAIKHGISLRTTPGTVRLAAARESGRLRIEIANDGPEETNGSGSSRRPGIGLANARAQLTQLYGTDYRLEMLTQDSGRTVVSLDLPWRQASAAKIS